MNETQKALLKRAREALGIAQLAFVVPPQPQYEQLAEMMKEIEDMLGIQQ